MNKTEAVQKGVEALKTSSNNLPKKEKTITVEDLELLIERLQGQFAEHTRTANEANTKAIQTRGAFELAAAQLEGLKNDTKPAN